MVHIKSFEDINLIKDKTIKNALLKEFNRLPKEFVYPQHGYFIVIEFYDELKHPIPIEIEPFKGSSVEITNSYEMIEEFEGYSQLVCLYDSDFGVSLFIKDEIADSNQLKPLFEI